ncbi:MAG: AraC family transcriptional regulator [Defluviitaleaceae bacterium]|nr:AraC family transcriptional regulator [Defluviitaleaceae bacterium]MCL2239131.1 AraC family transcriptional regulator [Defluviitaleaceae bacterium]
MEILRLKISSFQRYPNREYASFINDPVQLAVCHCHDYYEIFIVRKGGALHKINGAQMKIATGDLFFMRPDDIHYYDALTHDFEIINILVPTDTMDALFHFLDIGFEKERFLYPTLPPNVRLDKLELTALLGELEQLVFFKSIMREKSITAFRVVLFNTITRYFPLLPAKRASSAPEWLRWLHLEMMKKENFTKGLPAMYQLAGKSKEHISRICRKYLNKTPTQVINEIRLEYAAQKLITESIPVIQLCDDVGFESLSHFYHLFKMSFGLSPSEFRKNAKQLGLNDRLMQYQHRATSKIEQGIPLRSVLSE